MVDSKLAKDELILKTVVDFQEEFHLLHFEISNSAMHLKVQAKSHFYKIWKKKRALLTELGLNHEKLQHLLRIEQFKKKHFFLFT